MEKNTENNSLKCNINEFYLYQYIKTLDKQTIK